MTAVMAPFFTRQSDFGFLDFSLVNVIKNVSVILGYYFLKINDASCRSNMRGYKVVKMIKDVIHVLKP